MSGPEVGGYPGTAPLEHDIDAVVTAQDKSISAKHTGVADVKDVDDTGKEVYLEPLDPAVERKVKMKIDLIVLPLFFLIYGMQYLGEPFSLRAQQKLTEEDKIGISYAAIFGMKKDLHLVGQDYSFV